MGFFDRLSTVFKSNVNSVIDKMEDPEKILEQNISDMQKEYSKAKQSVSKAKAEEIRLSSKLIELKKQEEKWTNNAKLALSNNNEELAVKALSKKKEITEEISVIEIDRNSIENTVTKLVSDLKLMEKKIAEAKRKKNLLKSRLETAKAKKRIVDTKASINEAGAGAFSSFAKMEEKANRLINEADAQEIINEEIVGENLEAEFESLTNDSSILDELSKLKAEINV